MQPLQVIITGGSFIQEGNGVQIICSGSSNLANVIATWSKGEEVLQEGTVSLSYRFDRIHRNQSGVYKCKVRVNEETREQQFLVNVICKSSLLQNNKKETNHITPSCVQCLETESKSNTS